MISSKVFNLRNALMASMLAASALLTACGDSTGPSDTWPSDKKIRLLAPADGATVHVGDVVDVKWETKPSDAIDAADVELSPDNGKTWGYYLNSSGSIRPTDANWGDFKWTVPESVSKGGGSPVALAGNSQVLLRVLRYSTSDDSLIATMGKPLSVLAAP